MANGQTAKESWSKFWPVVAAVTIESIGWHPPAFGLQFPWWKMLLNPSTGTFGIWIWILLQWNPFLPVGDMGISGGWLGAVGCQTVWACFQTRLDDFNSNGIVAMEAGTITCNPMFVLLPRKQLSSQSHHAPTTSIFWWGNSHKSSLSTTLNPSLGEETLSSFDFQVRICHQTLLRHI